MKCINKINVFCCSVALTMCLSSISLADNPLPKPRSYIFDLVGEHKVIESNKQTYIKDGEKSLTLSLFGFNIGKVNDILTIGGNANDDTYLFRSNASIKRILPVDESDIVSKSRIVSNNDNVENINYDNQQHNIELEEADSVSVSAEDMKLLEEIVMAESGAEPYDGQIAVTNVIMNRVRSTRYPNTYKEVIFQPYQFSPAKNGVIKGYPPNESVKKAVREALAGKRIVPNDTLYFVNPVLATDQTVPNSQTVVKIIGTHTFYK